MSYAVVAPSARLQAGFAGPVYTSEICLTPVGPCSRSSGPDAAKVALIAIGGLAALAFCLGTSRRTRR